MKLFEALSVILFRLFNNSLIDIAFNNRIRAKITIDSYIMINNYFFINFIKYYNL
jgi:hypothetical protein